MEGEHNQPKQPSISEERRQLKCPSCDENHWLSQCDEFKKLRSKRSFCHVSGCTRKHSTFLHEKEQNQVTPLKPSNGVSACNDQDLSTKPTATAKPANNGYAQTFQASNSSSVIGLSIVPVKVKAKGQNKKVLTYAFLDSGSNTSFCTENLLRKLDVTGEKITLSPTTMQTSKEPIKCSLVDLEVSDLSDHNLIELWMVYSRPSRPVSTDTIGTQEDGITIPSIEAEIGLLIGSDVPQVLQPK